MPGVFISYRREDTSGYAGRLFDILSAHFGRDNTFMDLDTIRGGDNFVTVIEDRIALCDVLLAVIGERWLSSISHDGTRRLDQPDDFVRLEIAKALERNVRVIPVLVGNATVPREADLPPDLRPLALRHALDLRDAHFREDAQKLIELLDTSVPVPAPIPTPVPPKPGSITPWIAGAASLVLIAILATALFLRKSTPPSDATQSATPQQIDPSPTQSSLANRQSNAPSKFTPAPNAVPHSKFANAMPANPAPRAPETSAAASQLAGIWKATVTYDWPGAVYPETFRFEVDGQDLSGTASLLQANRAIVEGRITGDRVVFTTKTQTELDDKIYQDKNHYKGTLTGDTIQFTMLTDSEASEHTPIHFTAHRLAK